MEIELTPGAKKDLEFWSKSGNKAIQKKIAELLLSIKETPFQGIGKPEPLKHTFAGCWSRRISSEHRIIYYFKEECIYVLSLKDHYAI